MKKTANGTTQERLEDLTEAVKGALAALKQNKTYPADVEAARSFLAAAVANAEGR